MSLGAVLSTTLVPSATASVSRADELRPQQWGLDQIGAPAAWRTTRGARVVVAVIDSGVDGRHPDLRGRVLRGVDLYAHSADAWSDSDGHGTGVASVIAAGLGNGGMVGVAPEVTILPIKNASGNVNNNVTPAAIDYAVAHHAVVINISQGLIAPVEPVYEAVGLNGAIQAAIDRAWARGVVVIGAAGNDAAPWCSDPAASRHVVCVGGVDDSRGHVYYSHVDALSHSTLVVAPTAANVPLHPAVVVAVPGGGYRDESGTSFAAPVVAGVAALLAAQGLRGQALVDRLLTTCTDLGPAGRDPLYGYGEVNAAAAVARPRRR
jgi:subtilisin family serine protease